VRINVKDGTPNGNQKPLCHTCTYGTLRKGYRNEVEILCNALPDPKFPIYDCGSYRQKGSPSLREMEQMAHILVVDRRIQGGMGFVNKKTFDSKFSSDHRLPSEKDYY
jgi:hypothetical protein